MTRIWFGAMGVGVGGGMGLMGMVYSLPLSLFPVALVLGIAGLAIGIPAMKTHEEREQPYE
jgi:hypothetical protein